jgi:plasmid maintenance system antidote protein VapI
MLTQNKRRQILADVLEYHNWTHARLAKELDMSERNIRRYVSGKIDIPWVVCMALCWIRDECPIGG